MARFEPISTQFSAKKVNIGNTNIKTLTVDNLVELKVKDVFEHIKKNLD